jgi:phytoene dehydrogenase-like protein
MNLVGGDPYGGQCTIDQFFVFRPFSMSRNNDTVIRNLHHIGASTHPGPGLGGGSGFNAAKRLGA